MKYEIWRCGQKGWSHDLRDTYRWRWVARLIARWRTDAGWATYEVRESE